MSGVWPRKIMTVFGRSRAIGDQIPMLMCLEEVWYELSLKGSWI